MPLTAEAQNSLSRSLFVITRSKNANVLHYDVRLGRAGRLEPDDPMDVYWIMRAEDGRREALTWLERKFAYGYSVASRVTAAGCRVTLSAFESRSLSIERRGARGYHAYLAINGRRAKLDRIHVDADERGVTPRVRHVDLFGRADGTGASVSERWKP